MKCPECNIELPDGIRYFSECGTKLELTCPGCNESVPAGSKFWPECSHDLRKPQDPKPLNYNQPQSYTLKHLADKILNTRSSIEGERKLVTILFSDVANSTAMFERLDPEAVHEITDGYFRLIMDEIHRYEGTIKHFHGDEVMALFGAPSVHFEALSLPKGCRRRCHGHTKVQTQTDGHP